MVKHRGDPLPTAAPEHPVRRAGGPNALDRCREGPLTALTTNLAKHSHSVTATSKNHDPPPSAPSHTGHGCSSAQAPRNHLNWTLRRH